MLWFLFVPALLMLAFLLSMSNASRRIEWSAPARDASRTDCCPPAYKGRIVIGTYIARGNGPRSASPVDDPVTQH